MCKDLKALIQCEDDVASLCPILAFQFSDFAPIGIDFNGAGACFAAQVIIVEFFEAAFTHPKAGQFKQGVAVEVFFRDRSNVTKDMCHIRAIGIIASAPTINRQAGKIGDQAFNLGHL